MAKTIAPGTIVVPGVGKFAANAVPDVFDARDLEYRPRLMPLEPTLDQRSNAPVLLQMGNSCTGHAVATAINIVLARAQAGKSAHATGGAAPQPSAGQPAKIPGVSPYMLYHLARRYDEFEGEEDVGSSLRGAFKGWFHHGVALLRDWPRLKMSPEPDLDDPAFQSECRQRPLGAFYRVNPYRLDDMQSALNELQVIVVSSIIHDGWVEPVVEREGPDSLYLIKRRPNSQMLGGHAFALVGYNEHGFLVQNSWGAKWGKNGYATLSYDDWLDFAYDAWVARPGVPQTPFARARDRTAFATGGTLATAPALDLDRLRRYVVNVGDNGVLSGRGRFTSDPQQIEQIFESMAQQHSAWNQQKPGGKRHVVLYAHGGLVDEGAGLEIADKHLQWWLDNHVYPISFAWESGFWDTIVSVLKEKLRSLTPFGLIGFDLIEQMDRLVERITRQNLQWAWEKMKQNVRAASKPIRQPSQVQWPPTVHSETAMKKLPGATLTVLRLAKYIQEHGAENVAVHLVGHSAGTVLHAGVLARCKEAGIAIDSLSFLAPAIRVDDWSKEVLPHLRNRGQGTNLVDRFTTFVMSDQRELDDYCEWDTIRTKLYNKSLLYLVSRGFEPASAGRGGEVPLLGMEKFLQRPLSNKTQTTIEQIITGLHDGRVVISSNDTPAAPVSSPAELRSNTMAHGDFDDDENTMTSVLARMLQLQNIEDIHRYKVRTSLTSDRAAAGTVAGDAVSRTTQDASTSLPVNLPVAVNDPGEAPLVETVTLPEAPVKGKASKKPRAAGKQTSSKPRRKTEKKASAKT